MNPEKRSVHFRGRIITLTTDEVRLPNGHLASLEVVHHPGGAATVAIDSQDRVCLLKQYRYVAEGWLWELPAGKLEPNEPHLDTAKRELLEETGYTAAHWRHLGVLHTAIAYTDEAIELYLARGLTQGAAKLDAGEFLETLLVPFDDAIAMVRDGRITDVKTVAGLLWVRSFA